MPNWKGSTRRASLPANWGATCLRILTRDHHRCQWIRYDTGKPCLAPASDVDHIQSHADGGTDDDANLWSLCGYHHDRKTGYEGGKASGRARAATAAARKTQKPQHPGLIDKPVHEDAPPF